MRPCEIRIGCRIFAERPGCTRSSKFTRFVNIARHIGPSTPHCHDFWREPFKFTRDVNHLVERKFQRPVPFVPKLFLLIYCRLLNVFWKRGAHSLQSSFKNTDLHDRSSKVGFSFQAPLCFSMIYCSHAQQPIRCGTMSVHNFFWHCFSHSADAEANIRQFGILRPRDINLLDLSVGEIRQRETNSMCARGRTKLLAFRF